MGDTETDSAVSVDGMGGEIGGRVREGDGGGDSGGGGLLKEGTEQAEGGMSLLFSECEMAADSAGVHLTKNYLCAHTKRQDAFSFFL